MTYAPDARTLGELFSDLTREIATLVRNEVALARVEMSRKLSSAGRHAGTLAMGAVVALAGVFTLCASLVLILVAAGMPAWGSALLVGIVLAAIGGTVARRAATALGEEDLRPIETIETLKATIQWTGQTR